MIAPFDALVDAIIHHSGYRTPGSALHTARNLGGLKAYSPKAPKDAEGNRVFASDVDGLQALKFDVRLKLSGRSKAHCRTLTELVAAYGQPPTAARAWVLFMRRALNDQSVSIETPLDFYKEN